MGRQARHDQGFTLVELLIVATIIGVLAAMAIPIFLASSSKAAERTCRANQRVLEGAVTTWQSLGGDRDVADLAGVVNSAHPIIIDHVVGVPPTCPSAPKAADRNNPTATEGAYTFLANGSIDACGFGKLGPHGHF